MSKRSTLRVTRVATQSGAPVTTASWLVWAVGSAIMTPIVFLAGAVEPQPTWWSVVALIIAAAMATYSGFHAGRLFEARTVGRRDTDGAYDPRSVREATQVAGIVTAMVPAYTAAQIAPQWMRFIVVLLVLGAAAAWLLLRPAIRPRGATARRASRDAAR